MISSGLRVKIHYKGTLDDGTEFDNSYTRNNPLEFVMGTRAVLPTFESAVSSLSENERCTIHIPAVSAYGFYNEDLVDCVPVEGVGNAEELPVGSYIALRGADGKPVRAKVVGIENGYVMFDYNHPLAGKDLTFEIELLEVERKTAIESEKHVGHCDCHRVRDTLVGNIPHHHDECHCS